MIEGGDDGSPEVMQSPAYLAMTPSGKRVLHIIEGMTSRNGGEPVALSHSYFMARKMTQASSCKAVKQLVALGFVTVEADKRPNTSAITGSPSTRTKPSSGWLGTTAEATATIQQAAEAEASEAGAEADDGCAAQHAPGTVAADNALDGRRSVIGGFCLSVADKPGVVRRVVARPARRQRWNSLVGRHNTRDKRQRATQPLSGEPVGRGTRRTGHRSSEVSRHPSWRRSSTACAFATTVGAID